MSDETANNNLDDAPVLHVLKQIANGTLDARTLSQEMRQDCVRHMWQVKGQDVSTIAAVLKVSDKTIRRDKTEITAKDAQAVPTDYKQRLRGDLMTKMSVINDLMLRLANEKENSGQDRVQAGYYVWKMIKDEVEIAQSLGLLPSTAFDLGGPSQREPEQSPAQLKEELTRLEKIAADSGTINDPEVNRLVDEVRRNIALAEAKDGLSRLESRISGLNKAKEPDGGQ